MKLQIVGRKSHRVIFREDDKVFSRTYTTGMVFEGKAETLRNFPDKLKQVDDKTQVDTPPVNGEGGVPELSAAKDVLNKVDLNSMNVEQLRAYAEECEIDLGDVTKKADIIAAIQLSK